MARRSWSRYFGATLLALGGCAQEQDNRLVEVLGMLQQAQEHLNACIVNTYNDPQFEPLSSHMPMNMRGVTMDQLRDERLATDDEITMLKLYEQNARTCRKAYLDELRPVAPAVAALTEGTYSHNQTYLADLLDKRLSWGGYISGVVGNYRDLDPKLAGELQRMRSSPSAQ